MRTLANILSWVVLVVLLAMAVAFAGVRLVGLTPYAVLSGSMEPQYPVGSLIYVAETAPADIQPGQAITFYNSSGTVATHQAYEVDAEAQEIRTQGIANINSDGSIMHDAEPVSFSQVIGVPVACIPLLGYVNAFVTSGPGIVVVIAAVVAVVVLLWITGRERPAERAAGRHRR